MDDEAGASSQVTKQLLKRELGVVDLGLFYVAGALSLRWIATAAAAGPSTIIIWIFASLFFFVPLAASVLDLSSRYPEEGGVYVWTQRAFGDFSGFMVAWMYWMSNLPYFPAVLYFGAGSLLYTARRGEVFRSNSHYYLFFSVTCLIGITLLNVIGLKFGKWVNNLGALGSWIPVFALLVLACISATRFGSATHFTRSSLLPHADLKNAIFWSTIFFAFGGCETGSFMSEEIKDARRTIPRALIGSGIVLVLSYIAGTVALLSALPSVRISGLSGFAGAVQVMCARLGVSWMVVPITLLIALSSIGGAASFLSSTSRLPFVAGIDRYLPAAFGRVHPRWGTPWIAISVYGAAGAACAVLGQAGSSVQGAYDLLVSMSIVTYFIPFVFLFLAALRLQRHEAPAGVMRIPGGRTMSRALACVGLITTLLTIGLSLVPAADEPHKALAVTKVLGSTLLLVGGGVLVFWRSGKLMRASTK